MTSTDDRTAAPVPLVDLGLQHRRIAEEVRAGMDDVLERTSFVLGPQVTRFEEEYATYSGVPHCIGVGNGTDAVELALRGAGVGAGDEVVIPANTFVATAEAVVRAGARIVLADCDVDHLLDPGSLERHLTARTRAVIGVDLYGQVARFEEYAAIVGPDVVLVEDAAQSQGATRHGQRAGSFGAAAGTSFYPGKNLGAYGDAGAVTTTRDDIDHLVRQMRNHGGVRRYEHQVVGTNSRMDSLQAVVLSAKLRHLEAWNAERVQAAARYDDLLADVEGVVRPRTLEGNTHVWHLYVVRVAERDRVLDRLGEQGIGAGIHYPAPIHRLPAFSDLAHLDGALPVAEGTASEILSLPLFPGITQSQQERVVAALVAEVGRSAECPSAVATAP